MQVPEILTAPRSPVAKLVMQFCVAGAAKAHQVVSCMSATLRDGNDVVDLIHGCQPSFLLTHLAERMRRSVAVPDSLPGSAVLLILKSN